jgi:hypothetical protein
MGPVTTRRRDRFAAANGEYAESLEGAGSRSRCWQGGHADDDGVTCRSVRQCHRTRVVAVSDQRPQCFRNIEEQADCPEILQRRSSGDESLLTMMCGALAGSFAENLQNAAVEVVDREGGWQVVCRIRATWTDTIRLSKLSGRARSGAVTAEPDWQDDFAKPPKMQIRRLAADGACVGLPPSWRSASSLRQSVWRGTCPCGPRGGRPKLPSRHGHEDCGLWGWLKGCQEPVSTPAKPPTPPAD